MRRALDWWLMRGEFKPSIEIFPSPYRPARQLVPLALLFIVIGFLFVAIGS